MFNLFRRKKNYAKMAEKLVRDILPKFYTFDIVHIDDIVIYVGKLNCYVAVNSYVKKEAKSLQIYLGKCVDCGYKRWYNKEYVDDKDSFFEALNHINNVVMVCHKCGKETDTDGKKGYINEFGQ